MMKKTLLLCALALGLLTPTANAVTADDLDGKVGCVLTYGNFVQQSYAAESYTGMFKKTGTNTVSFDQMFGDFTVEFTINSQNTISLNLYNGNTRKEFPHNSIARRILKITDSQQSSSAYTFGGYSPSVYYAPTTTKTLTSTVYEDLTPYLHRVRFNYSVAYQTFPRSGADADGSFVMNKFDLFVIDTNALAVDDEGNYYPIRVTKEGNQIIFTNLADLGVNFYNDYNNSVSQLRPGINGTVSGNTFSISPMKVGDYVYYKNWGYITPQGSTLSGFWVGYIGEKYPSYIGRTINNNGTGIGNISGEILDHPKHLNLSNNYWVYDENINGTSLLTYKHEIYEIGLYSIDHQFMDNSNNLIAETRTSNKTTVYLDDNEYTHSVALQNIKMGYGEINANGGNYLYVEGDILPGENADYIENYELFVIPGYYTAVTDKAFNNISKGHDKGFSLEDYVYTSAGTVKPNSINPKDEEASLHFQYAVPESDLVTAGSKNNSSNAYTFYVKTKYTEESGLEPTFHALTAMSNTTTGVESIIDNGEIEEDAPVVYYNMNGVEVSGDALTPGLYIRKQGNNATKVVIK